MIHHRTVEILKLRANGLKINRKQESAAVWP
jgi:hypothetical protein